MSKTFEPTHEQQRFMLTGEQKLKMAALAKAFEAAMDEWTRAKAAILEHLEKVRNVANFEV